MSDPQTAEDSRRNLPGELRAWLMTYTGYSVSGRDAENLIDFLKKTGWKEPTDD